MKNFITLSLLLLATFYCLAQPLFNLEKYQYYKQRHTSKFIKYGRSCGESVPATCRLMDYPDNFNLKDRHLSFGDNPLHTGFLLMRLATEYRLLINNNQNASETLLQLCLVLEQVNRLDLLSGTGMGSKEYIPETNWPNPKTLDGFIIRDDNYDGYFNTYPDLAVQLLKKQEETTLYLIQLKEENERMKVQLEALTKRN